jgi:hypothetical protein
LPEIWQRQQITWVLVQLKSIGIRLKSLIWLRRRYVFGQRINTVPATGHPSRYFEQISIPSASFSDPRILAATASQPVRVERPLMLKAILAQINYGLFDVEVNQQQGMFAYLEAKDLTDTVDATLKLHDQALWNGNDTDLVMQTTSQYMGVSAQIQNAADLNGFAHIKTISASGSLVDGVKTQVATMAARTDFEVKPSALYLNPLFADLFDQEAKTLQLYYNEVEVIPGVIVKALPTQVGLLPLIPDPAITNLVQTGANQYTGFVISEEFVEYHYLTSPVPRVFQLGLVGNLAAQFVVVKFGAVVAKGPGYAHSIIRTTR